jgi:hypothetical protein
MGVPSGTHRELAATTPPLVRKTAHLVPCLPEAAMFSA